MPHYPLPYCPVDLLPYYPLPHLLSSPHRLAQARVDGRDLLYPAVSFEVLHVQNEFRRPVKMVGDVGYLLVEFV